jgi:hypothetical protein
MRSSRVKNNRQATRGNKADKVAMDNSSNLRHRDPAPHRIRKVTALGNPRTIRKPRWQTPMGTPEVKSRRKTH